MEYIGRRVRILEDLERFPEKVLMEALHRAIPVEAIESALRRTDSFEKRRRCLPARLVVLFVIAMNIWAKDSLLDAFKNLVNGLRWCSVALLGKRLPGKSALSQARSRLGFGAMKELYHSLARPMATKETPGAYCKGLLKVSLDGSDFDIQDTPENEKRFGRPGSHRREGGGAFPQAKIVGLVESATHAVFDAAIKRCRSGEQSAAKELLRSITEAMLVMWDRNFHSYELHKLIKEKGAQLLGRVKTGILFPVKENLSDGTFLSYLYPDCYSRKCKRNGILVRIIEYTFDDPNRPGFREKHRLITSLLDPVAFPAQELIIEYHERWEEELAFAQIKVHQRAKGTPLRSLTPDGVIQEIYGLLLAHYAVRALMHEAALKTKQDPDRLSFLSTLRIIQRYSPFLQVASTESLPLLYEYMLNEIAATTNPPRDGRINPRVVKRKMSNFKRKRQEHFKPPKPAKPFAQAIVLLRG